MNSSSISRQVGTLLLTVFAAGCFGTAALFHLLRESLAHSNEVNHRVMMEVDRRSGPWKKIAVAHAKRQLLNPLENPDELEAGLKAHQQRIAQVVETFPQLSGDTSALRTKFLALSGVYTSVVERVLTGNPGLANEAFGTEANPRYDALLGDLDTAQKTVAELAKTDLQRHADETRRASLTWIGLIGLAYAIAIGYGWRTRTRMVRQISTVAELLGRTTESLLGTADRLSAGSDLVAAGASQQAASLEETAASLEEVASMTRQNSQHASNAKESAAEVRAAADRSSTDIGQLNAAMQEIKTANDGIARIIKTIDEIAFQTNILALNAAVEAARAGDAGAGFAVVADEVRNLAQRSALAAQETEQQIQNSIQRGNAGFEMSQRVSENLSAIVLKARHLDDLVAHIASASKEQSTGVDQINTAVGSLDQVTQKNAGSAEESAHAAKKLQSHATALQEVVTELQVLTGRVTSHRNTSKIASPSKTLPSVATADTSVSREAIRPTPTAEEFFGSARPESSSRAPLGKQPTPAASNHASTDPSSFKDF